MLAARRLVRALALVLAVMAVAGGRVDAQPTLTGPAVSLSRSVVSPGDAVVVTIDGFDAGVVTISVCGNDAMRGSSDCNMTASKGLKLDADGTTTIAQIGIFEPPVPCPCLVRVSSRTNDEIAVAPVTILGHPTAPASDAGAGATVADSLAVSVHATPANEGFIDGVRFQLAGPGSYAVSVTLKNRATVALKDIALSGSVGRSASSDLVVLDLQRPDLLEAGQSWEQQVVVEVPAPSFGDLQWRVTASRNGTSATATQTTSHRPWLLIALVLLLVLDLGVLAMRFVVSRHARREAARASAGGGAVDDDRDAVEDGVADLAA